MGSVLTDVVDKLVSEQTIDPMALWNDFRNGCMLAGLFKLGGVAVKKLAPFIQKTINNFNDFGGYGKLAFASEYSGSSGGGAVAATWFNGFDENAEKLMSLATGQAAGSKGKVNGGGNGIQKVDYGDQYTKVNGKKVLKPNVEYTTDEGYTYTTDSNGRITSVEGNLESGKAKRNPYAQQHVGKGNGRLSSDDGGHLIATIFKGSGDLDNLVPMDATLNRGEWKSMENTWAKALDRGETVEVKVTPEYKGSSQRPISFNVKYKIDGGEWIKRKFDN